MKENDKDNQFNPLGTQSFKEDMFQLRQAIQPLVDRARQLMNHPIYEAGEVQSGSNPGEMKANTMLALRHLEDAKMRIGKAIQAFDGGVSCYPR